MNIPKCNYQFNDSLGNLDDLSSLSDESVHDDVFETFGLQTINNTKPIYDDKCYTNNLININDVDSDDKNCEDNLKKDIFDILTVINNMMSKINSLSEKIEN